MKYLEGLSEVPNLALQSGFPNEACSVLDPMRLQVLDEPAMPAVVAVVLEHIRSTVTRDSPMA